VNWALPPLYTAQAAVLVNTRAFEPTRLFDSTTPGGGQAALMATQIDLIRSDRVARRVVTELGLERQPEMVQQWREATGGKGDLTHELGRSLLRDLEVLPSRDSNVLQLAYTAQQPEQAVRVADAFAQAFVATGLELRVDPARDYAQWFDTRRDALRQQLEAAQARLSAYQRDKKLLPSQPGQIDVESVRLAELTGRQVAMQAARSETASLRRESGRADSVANVLNNPTISALRVEVARAEVQLSQLSGQLGEQHPQLRSAQEQLQSLKLQLQTEMDAVIRSVGTNEKVVERQLAEAEQAVQAQRQRVLALTQAGDQLSVLRRDVENAQRSLDDIEARRSQAMLEATLQQTNVTLLSSAALPSAPARPRVALNAVVGTVAGLLLGVGLALALEVWRPVVRRTEDLAVWAGLPVLVTVSRARLSGRRRWFGLRAEPPRSTERRPTSAARLQVTA